MVISWNSTSRIDSAFSCSDDSIHLLPTLRWMNRPHRSPPPEVIEIIIMRRCAVFLIGFLLSGWSVYADVADQVVLVRTEYPDSVVRNFERIASWFEESGDEKLAERFRGRALGGFAGGSVIRTPGGRILVLTNHYAAAQSQTVTLEFAGPGGSGAKFENCRVIAADVERDMALIQVPESAEELAVPLEFDTALPEEGTEVRAAGYIRAASESSESESSESADLFTWRLAPGRVAKPEAAVPGLYASALDSVIGHSAVVERESSGGPLLLKVGDDDYRIAGVNTWRYDEAGDTYFAVPAAEALSFIEEYGDIDVAPEAAELEAMLGELSQVFLDEFTKGGEPDPRSMKRLLSDELVSRIGWSSYADYRAGLEPDQRQQLDADFMIRDSYDMMREAAARRISGQAGENGGEVLRIRTPIDPELTEVEYRLGENEEVIGWKREMNRWVISDLSFIKTDVPGGTVKGSGLIDRDILPASAAVRGGAVFPIIAPDTPGVNADARFGFAFGAALDFFPSPFFGWGIGIEYHEDSFSTSPNESGGTIRVRNLIFPFSLRFQLPLRILNGSVTLIPWVSAGLSISTDMGWILEGNGGTNFPIHIQAPISAGFEMTTEKARDTVIWGVELSYIPPLMSPDFYRSGTGENLRVFKVSHFRFGLTVRFPFGESVSPDE